MTLTMTGVAENLPHVPAITFSGTEISDDLLSVRWS